MSEVDGATFVARNLKQQGVEYMFGIVGFPVTPIARGGAEGRHQDYGCRNEQSASYAAGAVGYLTGRPGACLVVSGPGVVHGLAGLSNAKENCWPMILIGGASARWQNGMGAFQEERQVLIATPFCKFAHAVRIAASHPVLCRNGRAQFHLRPSRRHLSRHAGRHHPGEVEEENPLSGALRRSAAQRRAAGEHRSGTERSRVRATPARHHRQRHGLVRRRGRSARLHRAHRRAVPRLPDGQGRDGRQPSAVGRRGAQPCAAGSRRDRADGRAAQLDHAFRPAAAVQQERAHRAARYLAGSDQPERPGRGGAGRRRQGDRRADEPGAGKHRVVLSGGYRLAQGDRRRNRPRTRNRSSR